MPQTKSTRPANHMTNDLTHKGMDRVATFLQDGFQWFFKGDDPGDMVHLLNRLGIAPEVALRVLLGGLQMPRTWPSAPGWHSATMDMSTLGSRPDLSPLPHQQPTDAAPSYSFARLGPPGTLTEDPELKRRQPSPSRMPRPGW
ncbi:MAG: hypothetical protein Alpg2KO_14940 [Alphaproteobacteria bacterium]